MRLTITIEMDNDACDGNEGPECARILTEFARDLEHTYTQVADLNGTTLRDFNGNNVGTVEVSGTGD